MNGCERNEKAKEAQEKKGEQRKRRRRRRRREKREPNTKGLVIGICRRSAVGWSVGQKVASCGITATGFYTLALL